MIAKVSSRPGSQSSHTVCLACYISVINLYLQVFKSFAFYMQLKVLGLEYFLCQRKEKQVWKSV